jgi:hypothetical protein
MPRLVFVFIFCWCAVCVQHQHFFIFSLRKLSSSCARQGIIMALFAQTSNTPLPHGKDLVLMCMDYRYYNHDYATNTTKFKFGKKMIWIGCTNCKREATYTYSIDFSVKHGFTNPSNHFVSCVGSNDNMIKILQARQKCQTVGEGAG